LWSGARVELPLPERFDALPHLRAAFSPAKAPTRQVCFFPSPRFDRPADLEHLVPDGTLQGAGNQTVELFRELDEPNSRWLVWSLASGFVVITIPTELGAVAPSYAAGLEVRDGDGGVPITRFHDGATGGDWRYPNQRDLAMFFAVADDQTVESVTIADLGRRGRQEPAFDAAEGQLELSAVVDRYKVSWSTTAAGRGTAEAELADAVQRLQIHA
jgi:hypothetical protein